MSSCMEHGYVESWVIMDGALIVYDPDDPPEWMKEAIASRDDDGNTPSFYKNHRGEQDRITCSGDVSW